MFFRNPYHHSPYTVNQQMYQQHYPQPPYHQPYQYYSQHFPYGPNQPIQGQPEQNKASQPNIPQKLFTSADGSFDFNKAVNQFDQMMKTANQISPIMKQIGSLFKK